MELGPFSMNEIESVKGIFESKKVSFEILVDEDLRDQQMAELNALASQNPKALAGQLDLKFIFIEIADADFEKVKPGLENYGIMEYSDGSYELGD